MRWQRGYDEDCGFCSRFAALMRSRTAGWPVEVVRSGSYDGPGAGLTSRTALLVSEDGTVRTEEAAVAGLLLQALGLWRLAGRIILWGPVRPLARRAYRLVARTRHRLPLGRGCRVRVQPASSASPGRAGGRA